jgi:hypothetical protein
LSSRLGIGDGLQKVIKIGAYKKTELADWVDIP